MKVGPLPKQRVFPQAVKLCLFKKASFFAGAEAVPFNVETSSEITYTSQRCTAWRSRKWISVGNEFVGHVA